MASNFATEEPQAFIYHERQEGNLCGVHALNNLLQGPYYSEVDLANIAEELDNRERALLSEQHQISDTQGQENQSSNVDETGNFSITVLREAIGRSHNIDLDQRNIDVVVNDPTQYEGFLLHLQAHWFAIRKIHGTYWNLNSLSKRPTKISEFYLSAFLGQMKQEGYSIFVVQGALPPPMSTSDFDGTGTWYTLQYLLNAPEPQPERSTRPEDVEDPELRAAIQASLQDSEQERSALQAVTGGDEQQFGGNMDEEDSELQAALAMSLAAEGNSSPADAPMQDSTPKETVGSAFSRLSRNVEQLPKEGTSTTLKIDFSHAPASSQQKKSVTCRFPLGCRMSTVFDWAALELLKQQYPEVASGSSSGKDNEPIDSSMLNFSLDRRAPSEVFTRENHGDRTIADCDVGNCVLQLNFGK
eukprot:gb/GECG01015832.1/.p1 GENE.gb/GECG01015832.1/~~gb/GECG01015832.1/.p1  ORF type:complete len:415 (+),score=68.92 gb/GECG01015832.1/:1-1245(+)